MEQIVRAWRAADEFSTTEVTEDDDLEDNVARDGDSISVPLHFMDEKPAPKPARLFVNDGPAETAYAAYKQRLSDAWRAKPLRDMKETGARQMSKDTLKQNARGGTVQPRSPKGSRVATPTASPKLSDLGVTDAALEQSQRVCAEARNKYWSDLGNAWQKVSSL